jgi:hypothetical protein
VITVEKYEHTILCFEGKVDPGAADLSSSLMRGAGPLDEYMDRVANGEDASVPRLGSGRWELISHDVIVLGRRTLWTLIFRRAVH